MIVDHVPDGATVRADVCVVGGGPAGITLALRLARDPSTTVCLFETGGLRYERAAQSLARGETIGTPYWPLHESRIRALGGSTWSWGGVCTPLDPIVFEERSWVDGAWPFPRTELEPYLDPALGWLGIDEASREATEIGTQADFAASGLDPVRLAPVPVHLSRPVRFGDAYRERLEAAPNLIVYLHSTITRLEVDGGRVSGATGRSRDTAFAVSAERYVLAGGGLENPRLLLISGIGGDAVGRYFMEHPRVLDRYAVHPGDTPLGRLVGGTGQHRRPVRIGMTDAAQRKDELVNWHADLRFGHVGQEGPSWDAARRLFIAARPPWNESPFYQDAGGGRLRLRSKDLLAAMMRPDRTILGVAGAVTGHPSLRRSLEVWSSVEQVPDPSNRLVLADDVDPLGMPRVRIHWTVGDAEERTYRQARGLLLGELERLEPGIASAPLDPDPWPAGLLGTWHHQGTTRMHDDPKRGVVDRDGRVHGVGNLSVAGSSVFPTGGSVSPTVTIVQLALRLAERLALEARTPVTVGG